MATPSLRPDCRHAAMRLRVLHVADRPTSPGCGSGLTRHWPGRSGVELTLRLVEDVEAATPVDMAGSQRSGHGRHPNY